MGVQNGFAEGIKVKATNLVTGEYCGTFESIAKAARVLFIRTQNTIHIYLNGYKKDVTFTGNRKGVKSYKTGIVYHFEKV